MEIDTSREGGTFAVHVSGRIQGPDDADALQNTLAVDLAPEERGIVLDLERAQYISSVGLRTIALTMNRLRQHNARLVIVAEHGSAVRALLATSGFDRLIEICDDASTARERARAPQ